jgi:serine/threonine-protein kinase
MAHTPTPEAPPPAPSLAEVEPPTPPDKVVIPPQPGEVITSLLTGNTYTMGEQIGEGNFGVVFSCIDVWGNDLAAKVLKPIAPYEKLRASAVAEMQKLFVLRHPNITYVFDAFEFRDTFYIITERCYCPLSQLLNWADFNGPGWVMPIARCLLQAVHYIHLNQYVHQDIHPGNVFAAFAKDEMDPTEPGAIQFKVGDLGVAKLFGDLNPTNTRALWMLPPEAFEPAEFGPLDYRIDIYHVGLLLLQLANSREVQFSKEEILAGRPREMALALPPPYNFALEKALRRHVAFRTASAMELWRDLHTPEQAASPTVAGEPGQTRAAEQADAANERAPASEPPARS